MLVSTSTGSQYSLGKPFAEGGEASIWSVSEKPQSVAKIYHTPSSAREAKVNAMVTHPPTSEKKLAVAWPTDLLYNGSQFVGYLMPKVSDSLPIFQFYNPARRVNLDAALHPRYPWPHVLHHIAKNLAAAVKQVHAGGHVIGDLNESNVLVNNRAIVTLVDADSFQIQGDVVTKVQRWPFGANTTHEIYHNVVGKAEFTAPELHGMDFKTVVRTQAHDHFALSVLIFYLLMDGYHPYTGVMRNGDSVGRVDLHCMREGIFPHTANVTVAPPPRAPNYQWLHPDIRQAFKRAFGPGHKYPKRRPSADEWLHILRKTATEQIACETDNNHIYYEHLRACPTCKPNAASTSLVDPQRMAYWFWQSRRIIGLLVGILWKWVRLSINRGRIALMEAVLGGVRDIAPTVRQQSTRRRQSERTQKRRRKWVFSAVANRPSIRKALRRLPRTTSWLWLRWATTTIGGALVGALIAFGIVVAANGSGLSGSTMSIVMLCSLLVGVGTGLAQQPLLCAEAFRLNAADLGQFRLAWATATGLIFLAFGAIGELLFAPTDILNNRASGGQNLVYWALMLGLAVGMVQANLLARYFARSRDRRRWTFASAVGWVLVAYGALSANTLWDVVVTQKISGVIGAGVGLVGYAMLTGIVFAWIVGGPSHHEQRQRKRFRTNWKGWARVEPRDWLRQFGLRWGKMLALLAGTILVVENLLGWLLAT